MAAGPNALRGSGPKQTGALWKWCVDPSGFSRSPERPYLHYVVMPSPIGVADLAPGVPQAASNSFGSLYLSLWTMMAQAILAILLASATAATFVGRRSINWPSHGRFPVPCLRAVADDSHCPDDKQPPQVSIALLGDAAEPILATGAVL